MTFFSVSILPVGQATKGKYISYVYKKGEFLAYYTQQRPNSFCEDLAHQ